MTGDEVAAALGARTPGPWRQTGTKTKPHWYITSDTAQVHGNFPATREDYTPGTITRWIADARAITVAVNLADPLWRVAEAARRMSDKRTADSDGFWVSAREMRYIDEALADLDANVEDLP